MEKLTLIGAGGMCKEVVCLIGEINKQSSGYEICGILDDPPKIMQNATLPLFRIY